MHIDADYPRDMDAQPRYGRVQINPVKTMFPFQVSNLRFSPTIDSSSVVNVLICRTVGGGDNDAENSIPDFKLCCTEDPRTAWLSELGTLASVFGRHHGSSLLRVVFRISASFLSHANIEEDASNSTSLLRSAGVDNSKTLEISLKRLGKP